MAVVYEDFLRCSNCNGADFKKEEILTLPLKQKKRDYKTNVLEVLASEYRYVCANCNTEVDR